MMRDEYDITGGERGRYYADRVKASWARWQTSASLPWMCGQCWAPVAPDTVHVCRSVLVQP